MALLNRKNSGFTLLETTLALAIITVFLIIPVGNYKSFKNNLDNTIFLKSFRSNWNHALLLSKINKKNIQVHFDRTYQVIKYEAIGIEWNKTIKVPQGLYMESVKDININRNGFTKPFKVVFTDVNRRKKITYNVQMEWGEMLNE